PSDLTALGISGRPATLLPVEARPEDVDAVDDPAELVPAVRVRAPQLLQRAELGEVPEAVLRRLGHRHLVGDESPVTFSGRDPEALGGLFGVEARRLARRHRAQEEPRAEPDRARPRRDEGGQITRRPES